LSSIEVAVLRREKQDLIVVPLAEAFELRTPNEKNLILLELRDAIRAADLDGELIAFWEDGKGRTRYVAPPELDAFCRLLTRRWLKHHLNARIEV
jgi:hypothetical protein